MPVTSKLIHILHNMLKVPSITSEHQKEMQHVRISGLDTFIRLIQNSR